MTSERRKSASAARASDGCKRDRRKGAELDAYLELRDGILFCRLEGRASRSGAINLSALQRFPHLTDPLARAFARWSLDKSPTSRTGKYGALRSGFLTFLDETFAPVSPQLQDIDDDLIGKFIKWLRVTNEDGSNRFATQTRRNMYSSARDIILAIRKDSLWASQLPDIDFPENLFPGEFSIGEADVLDDAMLQRIFDAAAAEHEANVLRAKETDRKLIELSEKFPFPQRSDVGDDPVGILYLLSQRYGRVPNKAPANGPFGNRNLQAGLRMEARALAYPTFDEILPCAILLALQFAFNPTVLFELRCQDVTTRKLFGIERVTIKGIKRRKGSAVGGSLVVTDDPTNPKAIADFLEKRCDTIRDRVVPASERDRLFLFLGPLSEDGASASRADAVRAKALKRFSTRHNIPYFTFMQLRPTVIDLAHELSEDEWAVSQFANHEDTSTTRKHYRSSGMRARGEEKLANGQNRMWQLVGIDQTFDPGRHGRREIDMGSATPGFYCLDPYSSPIPGEMSGRPCEAYGKCPICPLAAVDASSARSFAYLNLLKERIDEAQAALGPAWLARWAPVRTSLVLNWLPVFDHEELAKQPVPTTAALPPLD